MEQALQAREEEAREGVEQMREESLVDKWKALNDEPGVLGRGSDGPPRGQAGPGREQLARAHAVGRVPLTSKLSGVIAAKAIEQLLPQAFKGWCSYDPRGEALPAAR